MEYRQMASVRAEVGRMGVRPLCDDLLWRLRYDSGDATTLPIRILVLTGAAWVQKASRVRIGDIFGRRVQLESRSTRGRLLCSEQVSSFVIC